MKDEATLFLALTLEVNGDWVFPGRGVLIALQVPGFFDIDVVNLRQNMLK